MVVCLSQRHELCFTFLSFFEVKNIHSDWDELLFWIEWRWSHELRGLFTLFSSQHSHQHRRLHGRWPRGISHWDRLPHLKEGCRLEEFRISVDINEVTSSSTWSGMLWRLKQICWHQPCSELSPFLLLLSPCWWHQLHPKGRDRWLYFYHLLLQLDRSSRVLWRKVDPNLHWW